MFDAEGQLISQADQAEVAATTAPSLFTVAAGDSQIGLPDSVSLHDLINGPDNASGIQAMERDQRATLFEAALAGLHFKRPCLLFPRQAWSTIGRGL